MKELVYLLQCTTIVVCGTCALLVGSSVACGCNHPTAKTDSVAVIKADANDTDSLQIDICKRLLSECVDANILDAYGADVFYRINENPSVSRYMGLIEECEAEENFYDTVGSGDTWLQYCQYVLDPRGLLN